MDFCSFPPEFAPQELPLKSLSCVSRTGGVDSTHCWEEVSQESRAFLAGTLFRKLVVVALRFCHGPLSAMIDHVWIPQDN